MLQMNVVSFNVLALGQDEQPHMRSHRALRLDSQFHQRGAHVVGLQEARTVEGVYVTDSYKVYSSGRHQVSRATLFGCELWLHRRLPLLSLPDGTKLFLQDFQVLVVHADPRRLLVTLSGIVNFVFFVGHAPCLSSDHDITFVTDWWEQTNRIIAPVGVNRSCIAMMDANAPLASQRSIYYGMHHAEATNDQHGTYAGLSQPHWASTLEMPALGGAQEGASCAETMFWCLRMWWTKCRVQPPSATLMQVFLMKITCPLGVVSLDLSMWQDAVPNIDGTEKNSRILKLLLSFEKSWAPRRSLTGRLQ